MAILGMYIPSRKPVPHRVKGPAALARANGQKITHRGDHCASLERLLVLGDNHRQAEGKIITVRSTESS
jgi:hypothetical protein